MEEALDKLISEHEINIVKYIQEYDSIKEKIVFMSEHKFEHEREYLITRKETVSEILFNYQTLVENLRKLLNAWNS